MAKIRILIIEDSVVMRKLLSDAIALETDMEIVGSAANGSIGLQRVAQIQPDIVTLDVEMPVMDGLSTVKILRRSHPHLPVIMFSRLTRRGAETTLEALASGATDYVAKPESLGGVQETIRFLRENLSPKIRIHCGKGGSGPVNRQATNAPTDRSPEKSQTDTSPVIRRISPFQRPQSTPRPFSALAEASLRERQGNTSFIRREGQPSRKPAPVEIVCIGSSTGGPNALAELFEAMPANFPVPIVVVQHMPPHFTALLAERLNSSTRTRFFEGTEGMKIEPGVGYIAPGGFHMVVKRSSNGTVLSLNEQPPVNACRPAVDVLFKSVAECYGDGTLGVILTGMGHDGTRGAQIIKQSEGQIIAQDEESSVVWGMPGSAVQAGFTDVVLPLKLIAGELTLRTNRSKSLATS